MKKKLIFIFTAVIMFFAFSDFVKADYCTECTKEKSCEYSCDFVGTSSFSEILLLKRVRCGNIDKIIPAKIPEITSYIVTIVQVAVPIILIILGSIDLVKGITAQKDEEVKKGQQIFIKRLITAVIIFFVVVIVKLLISVVAQSDKANISSCIDCFISNKCS